MRLNPDEWIRPRRPRESFPPYELADRDLVARTEEQTRKLARLYHVAHEKAWEASEACRLPSPTTGRWTFKRGFCG